MATSIQRARRMMQREEVRFGERKERARVNEDALHSLEQFMDEVERTNLGNDQTISGDMWRRVEELRAQVPVPPPRDLWRSQLTTRLHDSLLRWQDSLLDYVAPQRLRFADRHD